MSELGPPPIVERRNPWAWLALGLILALMAVSSLAQISRSPESKPAPSADPDDFGLKVAVSMRAYADKTEAEGGKQEASQIRSTSEQFLESLVAQTVTASRQDLTAARAYGVMRTELNAVIPTENLAPLKKSKLPSDQALIQLFTSKKLTTAQAQAIAKKLPDQPFVYQIAKVEALEKAGDRKIRSATFSGNQFLAVCGMGFIGFIVFLGCFITYGLFFYGRAVAALSSVEIKIPDNSDPDMRARLELMASRIAGRRAKVKDLATPKGMPLGPISPLDADRLAWRAAQILGTFLALEFVAAYFHRQLGNAGSTIFASVGILLALPLFAAIPIDGRKIPLNLAGLSSKNLVRDILWGVGGFFFEVPLTLFFALVGIALFSFLPAASHPATDQILNSKDFASLVPLLIFGSIIAPIWEEFVFRGLIFPALGRVTGRVLTAAISTGLIFAMVHPQGPSLWLALGCVGTVGCGLTYQTRSLIPSIVMHMLHNTVTFAVALMVIAKP